jgi:hypothetical protein
MHLLIQFLLPSTSWTRGRTVDIPFDFVVLSYLFPVRKPRLTREKSRSAVAFAWSIFCCLRAFTQYEISPTHSMSVSRYPLSSYEKWKGAISINSVLSGWSERHSWLRYAFDLLELALDDSISPFNHGVSGGHLSQHLEPTALQKVIVYHPLYDIFLDPQLRDLVILIGDMSNDGICHDIVGWSRDEHRSGLLVWSEPYRKVSLGSDWGFPLEAPSSCFKMNEPH